MIDQQKSTSNKKRGKNKRVKNRIKTINEGKTKIERV